MATTVLLTVQGVVIKIGSLSQTVGCGDPDNYSDLTHEADTMQAVQGIKVFVIHSCFDCILKKNTSS